LKRKPLVQDTRRPGKANKKAFSLEAKLPAKDEEHFSGKRERFAFFTDIPASNSSTDKLSVFRRCFWAGRCLPPTPSPNLVTAAGIDVCELF
jgi:hypothetical protein